MCPHLEWMKSPLRSKGDLDSIQQLPIVQEAAAAMQPSIPGVHHFL